MGSKTVRRVHSSWLAGLVAAGVCAGCQSLTATEVQTGGGAEWTSRLPACPCLAPEPTVVEDGWALDRVSSLRQHLGAAACFRSYPPVTTGVGRSGQQCCYDPTGALVTSGSAAGTPDRATSCRGERPDGRMKVRLVGFLNHVFKDVRPWDRRYRSWKTYHATWPPDNTNLCPLLHVEATERGG